MIFAYSVMKGNRSLIGNASVHFPLLMATIFIIRVPEGMGATIEMEIQALYSAQIVLHLLCGFLSIAESMLAIWKNMETVVSTVSIFAIIYAFLCFSWNMRALAYLANLDLASQAEYRQEWLKFQFWL